MSTMQQFAYLTKEELAEIAGVSEARVVARPLFSSPLI
jgi:hypothetical protein